MSVLTASQKKARTKAKKEDETVIEASEANEPTQPEPLTVETLEASHPHIFEAVKAKGIEEGKKIGADAERERIKGVHDQCMPGLEAQCAVYMFDGATTPEQAAVSFLQKLKSQGEGFIAELADAPAPIADQPTQSVYEDDAHREWETDPKVQQQYSSLENYRNYKKAVAAGVIRE